MIYIIQPIKKTYNLRQESFLNELRILVSKKQLVELTVSEGWYSESEMKDELHWHKFGPQLSSFCPSLKFEICDVVDLCMSIGFDCFESFWWSSCVIILVIIDSCHIETYSTTCPMTYSAQSSQMTTYDNLKRIQLVLDGLILIQDICMYYIT